MKRSNGSWLINGIVALTVLSMLISTLPGAMVRSRLLGWWPEFGLWVGTIGLFALGIWYFRPRPDPQRGEVGYRVLEARSRVKFYSTCGRVVAIIAIILAIPHLNCYCDDVKTASPKIFFIDHSA